jgi:hypothetical protein
VSHNHGLLSTKGWDGDLFDGMIRSKKVNIEAIHAQAVGTELDDGECKDRLPGKLHLFHLVEQGSLCRIIMDSFRPRACIDSTSRTKKRRINDPSIGLDSGHAPGYWARRIDTRPFLLRIIPSNRSPSQVLEVRRTGSLVSCICFIWLREKTNQ